MRLKAWHAVAASASLAIAAALGVSSASKANPDPRYCSGGVYATSASLFCARYHHGLLLTCLNPRMGVYYGRQASAGPYATASASCAPGHVAVGWNTWISYVL